MSDSNRTQLYYVEESTWGTTPASALQELRFTGESLGMNLASVSSNEIRDDRQISDLVLTDKDPSGEINFELSAALLDDLLEGALFGDFSTAVAISATDLSAANADNSFNSTTTDFTAENISAGQWIKVAGFTDAANNGFCRVTSVAASKLVVTGLTLADEAAGDTVTMAGSMLRNGTTKKSYTLEKKFADITQFISYTGMIVSELNLSVEAGAIVTGSLGFMGKDGAIAQATVGTGDPTAAPTGTPCNAVSNVANLREGGAAISGTYAKSLSLALSNALRGQKAIGVLGNAGIGVGRCEVTGSISLYFEDETLYEKFIDNTETSIDFRVIDASGNGYIFTLPRVKYSSSNDAEVSGGDQDVMLDLQFQAIRHATYDCTLQVDKF
jgi:hypothetical protein